MGLNGQTRKGSKFKPGFKKRENKCIVTFDEKSRQEFLTGFHKRKVERRKAAIEELKNKLKEEQKRVREERHKEYLKMLKERKEALEEDELDDVVTGTTESVQYNHPNHTVTVTTISELDLTKARLPETTATKDLGSGDEEEEDEDTVKSLPKKSCNPILSKKIQSLTASIHTRTKQKKNRKGKPEGRGRGRPVDRKPAVSDNKRRLGRTSKKQRRKRTGRRSQHQD
ncbi:nucleolar protein 12 [Denticeps clupeoides]|uniref:Nucleolar protein 12 n=1 Tax=Denticeps clupeoides TaxID=299321 RepID=A0AAY4D755_9TELE|nr:nucleolar protein 12 [Denticeps clupeoides]